MKFDKELLSKIKDELDQEIPRRKQKQILLLQLSDLLSKTASEGSAVSSNAHDVLRRMSCSLEDVSLHLATKHMRDSIEKISVINTHLKDVFNYEEGSDEEKIGVAFCSILESLISVATEVYALGKAGVLSGEFPDPPLHGVRPGVSQAQRISKE